MLYYSLRFQNCRVNIFAWLFFLISLLIYIYYFFCVIVNAFCNSSRTFSSLREYPEILANFIWSMTTRQKTNFITESDDTNIVIQKKKWCSYKISGKLATLKIHPYADTLVNLKRGEILDHQRMIPFMKSASKSTKR